MDSISNQHNLSKLLLIYHKRTYFAKQANNNNIKHFLYTIAHLKPMDGLGLSDNLADFLKNGELTKNPASPKRKAQQLTKTEVATEQKTSIPFCLFFIDKYFKKQIFTFYVLDNNEQP